MRNPKNPQIKILFIHQNFPAQFGALAHWLAQQGWDVRFATQLKAAAHDQIGIVKYKAHRDITPKIHHYVANFERSVINGQGFAREAVRLRNNGYRPDIVVAHSGWGEGAFAKDVWPECVYVPYFEWYYNWPPIDRTPYDTKKDELDERARTRARNSPMWLDLSAADAAICPTQFQMDQFPDFFRDRLTVLPDGVDTELHRPGSRKDDLLKHLGIPAGTEILTFLARGMEPSRGFPEMMTAVGTLQKTRPNLHTIIVGKDRVAYGQQIEGGSWKKRMIDELDLDLDRIHFTGLVSRPEMISLFQSSDVHLYLTVPFVLSWSFLEAMSCGCLIVANDTDSVREFMTHNESGILFDMNNPEDLVSSITHALTENEALRHLRDRARNIVVESLDAKTVAYPLKEKFFQDLLRGDTSTV